MMSLQELASEPRLILALRLLVGGIVVAAGWGKMPRRYELLRLIRDQAYLPHSLARPLSRWLPWVELILGSALVVGVAPFWMSVAALSLFMIFTGFLIRARLAGFDELDCNCFGTSETSQRTVLLIGRNMVFIVLAGLLVLAPQSSSSVPLDEALMVVLMTLGLFTAVQMMRGALQAAGYRREVQKRRELMNAP